MAGPARRRVCLPGQMDVGRNRRRDGNLVARRFVDGGLADVSDPGAVGLERGRASAGGVGLLDCPQPGSIVAGAAVGIIARIAGSYTQQSWPALAKPTFFVISMLLSLAGQKAAFNYQTGVISTPSFSAYVAPSCSGFEGIGPSGSSWRFTSGFTAASFASRRPFCCCRSESRRSGY